MIRLLIGTASIAGLLAIYRRMRRPRRRNLVVIEGDGIRRIAQQRYATHFDGRPNCGAESGGFSGDPDHVTCWKCSALWRVRR